MTMHSSSGGVRYWRLCLTYPLLILFFLFFTFLYHIHTVPVHVWAAPGNGSLSLSTRYRLLLAVVHEHVVKRRKTVQIRTHQRLRSLWRDSDPTAMKELRDADAHADAI